MARLTDLTLRTLKPRGVQYAVLDDTLPNFGVRVGEQGTLSFFVLYTGTAAGAARRSAGFRYSRSPKRANSRANGCRV